MRGDGAIRRAGVVTAVLDLDGLRELHAETTGDRRVCVALLDGPVDQGHPSLRGAELNRIETLANGTPDGGLACRHGTHLAGLLFGQPVGPVTGIAPGCRGLVVPIFSSVAGGELTPCSQLD